jgi:hypothetical protein
MKSSLCIITLVAGSFLTACGQEVNTKTVDVRFQIVTKDGDVSGIPTDFLEKIKTPPLRSAVPFIAALSENPKNWEATSDQVEIARAARSKRDSLLTLYDARTKDVVDLFGANVVVCRIYWKLPSNGEKADVNNVIKCASGKKVTVALGRRMYTMEGNLVTIDEQFFVIPFSEKPVSFVTKEGEVPLKAHDWKQLEEEKAWGLGFMYSDNDTFKQSDLPK